MKAGDKIIVQRSSGEMENDWYFWTNWREPSNVSAFTAPECISVLVVKPLAPFTAEDIRSNPEVSYLSKSVSWADVLEWNRQ